MARLIRTGTEVIGTKAGSDSKGVHMTVEGFVERDNEWFYVCRWNEVRSCVSELRATEVRRADDLMTNVVEEMLAK